MAKDEYLVEGILLSQEEMDLILKDVQNENKKNDTSDISLSLSQSELDALFASAPKPAQHIEKMTERPKSISIVAARTKWTKDKIEKFSSGETITIDDNEEMNVEVLADGHCIANAVLSLKDGKKVIKITSLEN